MSIWAWIAGIASVIAVFFMGRKYWWAPIFGFICQGFWFLYIFIDKQYGLLICAVAYAIIYFVNIFKWAKERKND